MNFLGLQVYRHALDVAAKIDAKRLQKGKNIYNITFKTTSARNIYNILKLEELLKRIHSAFGAGIV